MRLGVFGDSFADINLSTSCKWPYNHSWPIKLTEMLKIKTDYHGQAVLAYIGVTRNS